MPRPVVGLAGGDRDRRAVAVALDERQNEALTAPVDRSAPGDRAIAEADEEQRPVLAGARHVDDDHVDLAAGGDERRPPVVPPEPRPTTIAGQLTCIATGDASVMSAHVQPSSIMTDACPESTPPIGAMSASSTPFVRVTGMISLSGWNATCAETFGATASISAKSFVARTAPISVSPIRV